MDESRGRITVLRRWIGTLRVPLRVTFRLRRSDRGPASRPRLRRGPDARSARRFLPDALPTDEPLPAQIPDPDYERRQRRRRSTAILGFVALVLVGVLTAILGPRGARDVRRAIQEREELREVLEARQESVLALRREVQRLQDDPRATERIAREALGYAKQGEITFVLPGDGGAGGVARRTLRPPAESTAAPVPGPG